MKAKSTNKFLSVALALFMLLMSVPFTMFASTTARAEEAAGVHELDAATLPNVQNKLDMATASCNVDGIVTSEDGFFKIHVDDNTRFDTSGKEFEDGFKGTQRINFNGGFNAETFVNSVEFTVSAAATVEVWWAKGDADRQVAIYNDKGEAVATSDVTAEKNAAAMSKFELTAAGKYYLSNTPKANYFFKIRITEDVAPEYVLDAATLPNVAAKGDMANASCNVDGIVTSADGFFKIHVDDNTRFDGSTKEFDDGFTGTQRINFNDGFKADTFVNSVEFTTSAPATVEVWWAKGDADRQVAIYNDKGEAVATSDVTADKNAPAISKFELSAAGKYYLGNTPKSNYIFKIKVAEQAVQTNVLDAATLPNVAAKGDMASASCNVDGIVTSEDGFFKIHVDDNTRFDGSTKEFDDGFTGTQRINFNDGFKADTFVNSIEFTTGSAATVTVWWAKGDADRQVAIYNDKGEAVATSDVTADKNAPAISKFELEEAGKYYLGNTPKSNYIFKVEVTAGAAKEEVTPWEEVAAPVITSAAPDDEGNIVVEVSAVVGSKGGDKVVVTMTDANGETATKQSLAATDKHSIKLTPSASGKYSLQAALSREGEEDKVSGTVTVNFVLPLGKPTISSATSKGNGTVEVIWSEVAEATGYEVFVDGASKGTTKDTTYMVEGLEVGKEYSITVAAIRGEEKGEQSKAVTVTTTKEAQMTWGYTMYGASVGDASYDKDGNPTGGNGYLGDLNKDGKVTVFSLGGKGKVVPTGLDGVSYYYTAVPSDQNFTLKAKFHVDNWTYSNGQDGFGLLAIDKLAPYKQQYWTNQYMLAVSKMEYWWDTEANKVDYNKLATSTKYSNVLGVGVNTKLGVTKDNVDELNSDATAAGKYGIAPGTQYPLDFTAATKGLDAGSYNIVGGVTNKDAMDKAGINALAETTDFVLELRKNNTGYFLTYYAADGKTIIGQQKFYDPKALSMVDEENVYVGFFAARNAQVTVSNVEFKTVDPKDDDPAEARPIEKIEPTVTVGSSTSVANSDKYTLLIKSNVAGTADVKLAGKTVATGLILSGENEYTEQVVTIAPGTNKIEVIFTPDKEQELPEFTELSSTDPITTTLNVKYETYFANQKNLYVSPKGTKGGNGGKEYPLDIYTAVKVAQPGQTIILMEGTYELTSQVLIERGIDGTKDNMINMIADPEAKTRPVLDFKGTKSGMKVGGSYWYFQGFDVTNAGQKTPGMVVSGNNNVVDNVNAYDNTDTGIFIKALKDSNDPKSYWPSNNLILNCTSHNNADAGMEDADGFACKLTSGAGNVFDGCVAYNNADDGWDLYAKTSTGEIGAVTIINCVAYNNGILEDGTNAGNGNGFKMGGENLPGGHKIINSVSFNNKANGITCNSCPDISIENCTVFNNGSANVTVYSTAKNTNFSIKGLISFRTEKTDIDDSLKPNGTQKVEDLYADNNYFWLGGASANKSGAKVTADMFKSLEFKGSIARNADNTINMEDFLVLTETAPQDAGARMSGTPSKDFTVTADSKLPPPTGFEVTLIVVVIAISAAVAIVLFRKRKNSK